MNYERVPQNSREYPCFETIRVEPVVGVNIELLPDEVIEHIHLNLALDTIIPYTFQRLREARYYRENLYLAVPPNKDKSDSGGNLVKVPWYWGRQIPIEDVVIPVRGIAVFGGVTAKGVCPTGKYYLTTVQHAESYIPTGFLGSKDVALNVEVSNKLLFEGFRVAPVLAWAELNVEKLCEWLANKYAGNDLLRKHISRNLSKISWGRRGKPCVMFRLRGSRERFWALRQYRTEIPSARSHLEDYKAARYSDFQHATALLIREAELFPDRFSMYIDFCCTSTKVKYNQVLETLRRISRMKEDSEPLDYGEGIALLGLFSGIVMNNCRILRNLAQRDEQFFRVHQAIGRELARPEDLCLSFITQDLGLQFEEYTQAVSGLRVQLESYVANAIGQVTKFILDEVVYAFPFVSLRDPKYASDTKLEIAEIAGKRLDSLLK